MKLVTVATHSEGYFPYLVESCRRYNIHLNVLGWGQKWQGFTWRLHLMMKWLKELDYNEIVCFIDGFDVIVLQPLEVLEYRFKKIKKENPNINIISAYENQCWYLTLSTLLIFGTCKNIFINAGTYIGYAGDILKVIEYNLRLNPEFDADDQQLLLTYCRNNPNNVYIDIDKNLFLTKINPLFDITNDIIENINKYNPCILHVPCVTNLNKTLKKLEYTITQSDEININTYIRKTILHKMTYYLYTNVHYLLYIALIIIIIYVIFQMRKYY